MHPYRGKPQVPTARFGEHRGFVVLDEVTCPLRCGWLPLEPVRACLRERPASVNGVLPGRGAPQELIALAGTVTEMTLVKQHFNAGVPTQRGIDE